MKQTEMICIGCPLGCMLTVTGSGDNIKVSGNTCKKGVTYAIQEINNPKRMVTTTVRVRNGELLVVSVKTNGEIPKGKIMECMKVLANIIVDAPVSIGDEIMLDILGTGIQVVATKSVGIAL